MKAMNMIRAAILVGILGASPAFVVSAVSGPPDAYPIRNQMVYDEDGTRDAYPIRNQMVGTRDAYPIRKQMVYDEENSASQSWLRRWLGPQSTFFVRLITYVR